MQGKKFQISCGLNKTTADNITGKVQNKKNKKNKYGLIYINNENNNNYVKFYLFLICLQTLVLTFIEVFNLITVKNSLSSCHFHHYPFPNLPSSRIPYFSYHSGA